MTNDDDVEAWVKRTVEAAPPLEDWQRDRLVRLLTATETRDS